MHEMGIAQSVIEMAVQEAERHGARSVLSVALVIGELSGVDTESLRFCFDCLKKDTLLDRTKLEIRHQRRRHLCTSCGQQFEVVRLDLSCPHCHCEETQFLAGDELELSHLELEAG